MPLPKQSAVEVPLLESLIKLGGAAPPKRVYDLLADRFGLTPEERQERMEQGAIRWWNLVQWVRQKLVERGEIDGSQRGIWRVTDTGRQRLKVDGDANAM